MHVRKALMAIGFVASTAFVAQGASAQAASVDPALPSYAAATGVAGNLTSVGSDTLNNVMTLWAESFKRFYPNVNIQIQGAGSGTAPPALTAGAANFGPMSRLMNDKEIEAFEKKFGYKPTAVPAGIDALAVFVNKDNPIRGLTIPQIDAIYSITRKCGAPADVERWGQLGMTGEWANRNITMYGRNSVSGTYGYFKERALCRGDFKKTVAEQPGSASVVQSVSTQIDAIGYTGIGYRTSGVRAIPLAPKDGAPFVEPTAENAANGSYPLARILYFYVNKRPNQPLPPLEREFIKLVLSKQGQEAVLKDGFVPLSAGMARKALAELGIN
ncbi:MAG: phosphate ABC transporter substrate-binding protein PstS family protein [Sulfuritalea sp.]|nr:phosphate ABC transporter substrate-binding protein PstS family protein [Sulfuritalea sp.]